MQFAEFVKNGNNDNKMKFKLEKEDEKAEIWVKVYQALGTRSFEICFRSFKTFLGHVFFFIKGLVDGSKMSEFGPRGEGGQHFKKVSKLSEWVGGSR